MRRALFSAGSVGSVGAIGALAILLAAPSARAQADVATLQQMRAQLDSGRVLVWPIRRGEKGFILVDRGEVERLIDQETRAGRMSPGAAQAILSAANDVASAAREVVAADLALAGLDASDGGSTPTGGGGGAGGNGALGGGSASLTGLWKDDTGGGATYRVRQEGASVWWFVDGTPQGSYVNLAVGSIANGVVQMRWVDLPGSPAMGGGDLQLRVDGPDRLTKVGSTAIYGANAWTRVGGGASAPPPVAVTPAAAVGQSIGWADVPLPNYRGQNGKRITYSCPAWPGGGTRLWGTDEYTDDSSVCDAALHAGAIGRGGGTFTVELRPGAASYAGSERNGVTSASYGSWYAGFVIVR